MFALACAALAVAAAGALAPVAAAAAGNPIINDCEANGQLTHTYTLSELRHALAGMPASVKQYTNCYDVIQMALIQARKTGSAGPATASSGSSLVPTPVIVVLIVLVLGAVGLAVLAVVRRRRSGGGPGPGGQPPA
jgi:hypothetical protein